MTDILITLNTNKYNLLPSASLGLEWEYSIQALGLMSINNSKDVFPCAIEIGLVDTSNLNNVKQYIKNYAIINNRFPEVNYSEIIMPSANSYAFGIPYRHTRNYAIHSDDNEWFGSSGCIVVSKDNMHKIHHLLKRDKSLQVRLACYA